MNFETYLTQTIQKAVKEAITEKFDELKEVLNQDLKSQNIQAQRTKSGSQSMIVRPSDMAEMLSVNRVTVWRMKKRGDLPPRFKISNRVVGWLRSDIEEWLVQMKEN